MLKSRWDSPSNPLQRYVFLSYVTIFSTIVFGFGAYMCVYQ